ncbi:MAG: hypothetical protein QG642_538 [Patescibacteria group bacterium]|nr:hypothetical protein [Patescibacteria group bacterium]
MGHRTLKRVPLDFRWPMDKVWKGYINPTSVRECPRCAGAGYNLATKQIADDFYDHDGFGNRWIYAYGLDPDGNPAIRPPWLILGECRAWRNKITQDEVNALVAAGRLTNFTHTYTTEGWQPREDGHIPTADEVNAQERLGGLNDHDCINRHILIEARAKRLGVWGLCRRCHGHGEDKLPRKLKKAYKKWREYEPPTGSGYQLWETCSEGSPISPVFASAEELAVWCTDHATIFADEKTSYANWLKMFVGEESMETGSLFMINSNFRGAVINAPS